MSHKTEIESKKVKNVATQIQPN